jgi:WD40 repeat protein
VLALAFSPDGSVIASASRDNTVIIWKTLSGEVQQTITGHSDWVYAIGFSPDGSVVASASRDETIKLWDVGSGKLRDTINVDLIIGELSFSDNGSHLNTNRGVIDISKPKDSLALFVREQWIIQGTKHILWLPPDYRATTVATFGNIIALGHASGRVSILEITSSEDF